MHKNNPNNKGLYQSPKRLAQQVACKAISFGLLVFTTSASAYGEVAKELLPQFSQTQRFFTIEDRNNRKLSLSSPHSTPTNVALPKVTNYANSATKSKAKAASTYPQTHFQRGKYLQQIGRNDDALIEFLKATQENPRLVQAFYEQALIFQERGYLRLAESALEQALVVKPDYQKARILLATIRLQQGNLNGAVNELSMSLGLPQKQLPIAPSALENKLAQKTDIAPSPAKPRFPAVMQTPHTQLPNIYHIDTRSSINNHQSTTTPKSPINHSLTASTEREAIIFNSAPTESKLAKERQLRSQLTPKDIPSSQYDKPQITKNNQQQSLHRHFGFLHPIKFFKGVWSDSTKEKIANSHPSNSIKGVPNQSIKPKQKRKHSRFTGWFFHVFDTAFGDTSRSKSLKLATAKQAARNKQGRPEQPHYAQSVKQPERQIPIVIRQPSPTVSLQNETARTYSPSQQEMRQIPLVQQPQNYRQPEGPTFTNKKAEPLANSKINYNPTKNTIATDTYATFKIPTLSNSTAQLLSLAQRQRLPAAYLQNRHAPLTSPGPKLTAPKEQIAEDPVIARLKYLAEHGNSSLKHGEAFMFSEDTGEAVLFLADGQKIRRKIAPPQDPVEVVKTRRPDLAFPQELRYNLSLLAKLLPRQTDPQPEQRPPGKFTVNELLSEPSGFLSWLRSMFTL